MSNVDKKQKQSLFFISDGLCSSHTHILQLEERDDAKQLSLGKFAFLLNLWLCICSSVQNHMPQTKIRTSQVLEVKITVFLYFWSTKLLIEFPHYKANGIHLGYLKVSN